MAFGLTLPGTAAQEHGRVTPRARHWRIFWSYLPDWCLTIFLWGIFYLLDKIDGYRRRFSVTDTSLAYPYADPERIKVWHLAIYAGVIPFLIIVATGLLVRRSPWDVHAGVLGFLLNLGLTITFTNIIKITAGRPRPDLFDRCQLPADLTSNPVHGLVDWTVCTRTDMLQEGFRSFPSGHSSFAWAGMWYLILYSAAKMRISNRRGYTWKSWLLLAPLSCAALVSVSRTMDYRHHSTDVIAGAVIGVLAAWFAYRQFYPPLGHPQAYKAYSPRVPKDDESGIPLHQPHASTSVRGRQSGDLGPRSALLPAQPPASVQPLGRGNGAGAYPMQGYETGMGGEPGHSNGIGHSAYGGGVGVGSKVSDETVDYEVRHGGTGAVEGDRELEETARR